MHTRDTDVCHVQGTIKETGTHAELMAARGIYYSLVAKQAATADVLPSVPSTPTSSRYSQTSVLFPNSGNGKGNGVACLTREQIARKLVHASTASMEQQMVGSGEKMFLNMMLQ